MPRAWIACGLIIITGCAENVEPDNPAACIAAFNRMIASTQGTPLASDPRLAKFRRRAAFALEELRRQDRLTEGQEEAVRIETLLQSDLEKAGDLAIDCVVAQDRRGEFQKRERELPTERGSS